LEGIIVVGGGAAGLAAAEALRADDFTGPITMVCGEPELPYDRPPLSKQVLTGAWEPDRARFREAAHYAAQGIRLLHGQASSLSLAQRTVGLADGYQLGYDGLIIATGARPRLLPAGHQLSGVHVLRGLAEVTALKAAFGSAGRVVIVGAGFLGMEVAAAARGLGLDVTVADPLPEPMIRQVGPLVGAAVAELHRAQGVVVRTGTGVTELLSHRGSVTGVVLGDGTVLPADCVLIAIGALPETGWLAGSGLSLGNGVDCDEYLRAAPDVYAAGDVASWVSSRYRRRLRVEHRMNASEMGAAAAANLLRDAAGRGPAPFDPVPYFWSDQYKVKLQVHGDLDSSCAVTVEEGAIGDGKFVVLFHRDGVPTAVLGWNAAARMPAYRKRLFS